MNRTPFTVTSETERVRFFVSQGFIPHTMAAAAQDATLKTIIRIAGGMNNVAGEIYPFFRTALRMMNGSVIWSGGTRCLDDRGKIQASVAEVVADTAEYLPQTIRMGSFPRTAPLNLTKESTLVIGDGENTFVNPGTAFVAAIQTGPEDWDEIGWDGDLEAYIFFMKSLRDINGFRPAVIVWNGGGVTIKEAEMAREAGFPVFVITDTGRAADNQLAAGAFTGKNVYHINKSDPLILLELLSTLKMSN